MDSTSLTTVSAAADIWRSLGVELAIFVVTLAFALIIRGFNTKATASGKHCVVGGSSPRQKVASHAHVPRSPCCVAPDRCAAVAAEVHLKSAAPPAAARKQITTNQSTGRSVWQIADEVIDGMKEQQSMKFAGRALALYDELRARLREDGLRLSEVRTVGRLSKYSSIDFYTTVIHCAIRAGRHHLVQGILDDMCEQGVARPLAFYESTMKQLAGQKQYHLALSVFDRLSGDGLKPSAVTCSCLIGFAAEVGELQRAVGFFDRLSALTTPSIRAYMTVLRVHAKRQDWPASLETIRDMQRRGVPPDSLALNVALATGVAADRLEAVAALVAEAEAQTPPTTDVVSYNTVIKGYAQRGDSEGAVQALKRMQQRNLAPNAITFNTTMDAAVRGARVDEAWRLLSDLRSSGLRPDKFTCSILVKGLVKSPTVERVRAALELLREVDGCCDVALRSTLYRTILEAAAQVPDGGAALALQASRARPLRA